MLTLFAMIIGTTMAMTLIIELLNAKIRRKAPVRYDLTGASIDPHKYLRIGRTLAITATFLIPVALIYVDYEKRVAAIPDELRGVHPPCKPSHTWLGIPRMRPAYCNKR